MQKLNVHVKLNECKQTVFLVCKIDLPHLKYFHCFSVSQIYFEDQKKQFVCIHSTFTCIAGMCGQFCHADRDDVCTAFKSRFLRNFSLLSDPCLKLAHAHFTQTIVVK